MCIGMHTAGHRALQQQQLLPQITQKTAQKQHTATHNNKNYGNCSAIGIAMAGQFPFQLQFLLLRLSVLCLCNLWQKLLLFGIHHDASNPLGVGRGK